MSIIMKASEPERGEQAKRSALLDPAVTELLDHIAVELAAEYVRLMETAAEAAAPSPTTDADDD
jgi:hypothetical protein